MVEDYTSKYRETLKKAIRNLRFIALNPFSDYTAFNQVYSTIMQNISRIEEKSRDDENKTRDLLNSSELQGLKTELMVIKARRDLKEVDKSLKGKLEII